MESFVVSEDVTQLLREWSQGDRQALDRLVPLIITDLRRQARQHLRRERPGHTLQPTALVNEVFLRLVDQRRAHWRDRAHFFAVAAKLMRRILVDHARAHAAEKRGGGLKFVEFDESQGFNVSGSIDLIALNEALETLAEMDERQCRVVELRFFAGLTIEETAEVLSVTHATISRDWRNARAWLLHELRGAEGGSSG